MNEAAYRYPLHYVTADWVEPPERFKQLADMLKGQETAKVLDVGCAAGELIHYLSEQYPNMVFTGIDNYPLYIKNAERNVPNASFKVASALDLPQEFTGQFDVVLAMGVLGIFDDAGLFFDNLIRCTRKGGKIIVFSHFNEYPVDTRVKHRQPDGNWQSGWNVYSMETVGSILGDKPHKFHKFTLPFALPHKPEDPIRTWTIETKDNHYQLVNGLKLWVDYYFLEVSNGHHSRMGKEFTKPEPGKGD